MSTDEPTPDKSPDDNSEPSPGPNPPEAAESPDLPEDAPTDGIAKPRSGPSRALLIALAAVLVLVIAGVGAFFVLHKSGPADVAQRYFDKAKAKDCTFVEDFSNKMISASSESDRSKKLKSFEDKCKKNKDAVFTSAGPLGDCKWSSSDVKTKGDSASLKYKISGCKNDKDNSTGTLRLVKEHGKWRVDR